jgi:hypothetical protein
MDYVHDLLTVGYRKKIVAAIYCVLRTEYKYADGDFDLVEMYEIMLMPVIQPTKIDNEKSKMWLKYLVFDVVNLRMQIINNQIFFKPF